MKTVVEINPDATVAYLPGIKAAVTLEKSQQPTTPIPVQTGIGGKIAPWGEDNLFPQTVLEECESNTIIPSTLDWKARALYSGGIEYGRLEFDDKNEEKFVREKNSRVEEFFKRSNIRRYLIEACTDFYWFFNVFPELILSIDRKEIVGMTVQEASYCRWGLQNPSNGKIEHCYINANWDRGYKIENTTPVPVIDPYFDPVNILRGRSDSYKYIYPVSYPTPGKTYYQLAYWNSIRQSGWLDVANSIPKWKKAMMKNQITIKYHIEVADYWWKWKYPTWDTFSAKERKEKFEAELKKFNDFLQGNERAGTSIITAFKSDPISGKEYSGWKITAVDDKVKDGKYIEDSQEASSHLLYALGVDATLIGTTPGKGLGAGSGSDKREAFNIYQSLADIHADIILEPLYFINDYNGWGIEKFRFRRPVLQTLNQVPPSNRNTAPNAV